MVKERPRVQRQSGLAALGLGPSIALGVCNPDVDTSVTLSAPNADGQLTQHYTLYWQRKISSPYYSWLSTQTNVWWTRLDSNYDIYQGQTQNSWNFTGGWQCMTDASDSRTISSALPFSPNWPGPTGDSTTYVYNGPMNTWPSMYRSTGAWPQNWSFPMTTQVSLFGSSYGSISDSYAPPINAP